MTEKCISALLFKFLRETRTDSHSRAFLATVSHLAQLAKAHENRKPFCVQNEGITISLFIKGLCRGEKSPMDSEMLLTKTFLEKVLAKPEMKTMTHIASIEALCGVIAGAYTPGKARSPKGRYVEHDEYIAIFGSLYSVIMEAAAESVSKEKRPYLAVA